MNVGLSLSTDAHGRGELHHMRHAVAQARRGWVRAEDVLNTRPIDELRSLLTHRR
jgi:DNA polymerase (family 10)